ncbi:3'(2'),5'-bisphosphate nucleotidase CysQ [Rhizosaccharibacter radicis]|uniref:3'(2'),5'-bisphosphate nucleotidase CysQ n=1 Tax=Rhizosaccharibacter radicis TaxID=2782605 RepID=A0ABT1W118_9PROT|nr:3'(2'),5'-bisphosphate nucleotidase CysQ [Acetobacteraceae bacterium KSS12]
MSSVLASADDHVLAGRLATLAGDLLMSLRGHGLLTGRPLGDAGDRMSNAALLSALRALRPDDAVLSEEEAADPARLGQDRVWIVDPLDGTREYAEGRPDWAVHVALTVGGVPAAGAVALPATGLCFLSGAPVPAPAATAAPPRMVVSRSRPAREALHVARALDAALLPMGSAGAKAMAVLRGEADIYLHAGGMHEWDSCAPAAVALASGLHASRIDGSPLRYNRAETWLPDLLICRREWAEPVLALVRATGDGFHGG